MVDKKDEKPETVLVPPAGVHTPGRTAMGGESPYVEVPVDALANPEETTAAYEKAQRGEHDVALPAGVIPQNHDGSAMSQAEVDDALEDEKLMQDHIAGKPGGTPADKQAGAKPADKPKG